MLRNKIQAMEMKMLEQIEGVTKRNKEGKKRKYRSLRITEILNKTIHNNQDGLEI